MNLLFSSKSLDERGTIENLRNVYRHRGVKPLSVMNSFNHTADFIRYVQSLLQCQSICIYE